MVLNFLPLTIDYDEETVTSLFGDEYDVDVWDPEKEYVNL